MKRSGLWKLTVWAALWLTVALAGSLFAQKRFQSRADDALFEAAVLANEQRISGAMRGQNARADLRSQRHEIETRFFAALGGGAVAAFNHPDYSIFAALLRGAQECAPRDWKSVKVSVDRFTEFTVTIFRDSAFSTNEMAEIARCYLPHAAQYVFALRFSQGETLIAELDRADIELIEDWSRATLERVAMLLPREVETVADGPVAERVERDRKVARLAENDPALTDKLARAQEAFFAAARAADESLREAISLSDTAANIGSDPRAANFSQRRKDLQTAAEQTQAARKFWANPGAAWRTALEGAGAEPSAVDALAEMFGDFLRHNDAKAGAALDALEAKIESSRFFLQAVEEQIRASPADANAFTVENAALRVKRALEHLRADARALETALRDWSDARAVN